MHVNGFHWFHWFSLRVQMWCVQAFRWSRRRAKEMPLQQFHLRPRADALCLRTCHPVPRRPLHRTSGRGTVGTGNTAWRNVKSCEEMWRDVKGMLTGWEWPCMTWEGDLEPGFEVRKGTPSLWGWVGWLTILRCVIFVFATLIKTESNHIKSNMFYSEVANLTQFLYTALSGCQGGPGRSLKILSLRVASCRFVSLRVASCRLRAGRWLQRSKAKGHQLGGYREWYPKIRREHCSAGETMGKPGNQCFFFFF